MEDLKLEGESAYHTSFQLNTGHVFDFGNQGVDTGYKRKVLPARTSPVFSIARLGWSLVDQRSAALNPIA